MGILHILVQLQAIFADKFLRDYFTFDFVFANNEANFTPFGLFSKRKQNHNELRRKASIEVEECMNMYTYIYMVRTRFTIFHYCIYRNNVNQYLIGGCHFQTIPYWY